MSIISQILEKIENILQETPGQVQELYEFAINRKKVKDKIEEYADTIVDHICKIIYLKDKLPNTVHHWCSEILAKINLIIKYQLKGGNLKRYLLSSWLRNGLTNKAEMKDRRELVAIQEKLPLNDLKSLQEETDYKMFELFLNNLIDLIMICREEVRQANLEDIQEIVNKIN